MEPWRWRHPWVTTIGWVVIAFLGAFILFFLKVHKESRLEFARAESEFQSGQGREAVVHYERAIMWHTPWSRAVQRSVERLWEIGEQAEANQEASLALEAYRALRASLYGVRSAYQPYEDWIAKCDTRIVRLMAVEKAGPGADPADIEKHRARYAEMHARKRGPTLGGAILTEIGFLGWVGAALGLIWYGLSAQGNWMLRPCVWWGSGVVIFFATWVIGMLLA